VAVTELLAGRWSRPHRTLLFELLPTTTACFLPVFGTTPSTQQLIEPVLVLLISNYTVISFSAFLIGILRFGSSI